MADGGAVVKHIPAPSGARMEKNCSETGESRLLAAQGMHMR
jgi:hypothetical protein